MPRIRLAGSSSSEESLTQDRAIDSNKALATVFCVRSFLIRGLKGLLEGSEENKAKRFIRERGEKNYQNMIMRVALNRLRHYLKTHAGHSKSKYLAAQVYKERAGKRYLNLWRLRLAQKVEDRAKLAEADSSLARGKKLRVFKEWRAFILQVRMCEVQLRAADRIYSQRRCAEVLHALMSYARYSIRTKYLEHKSTLANRQRLLFRGLKQWKRYMIKQKTKVDIETLADNMRSMALQRLAFNLIKEFLVIQQHERTQRQWSKEFRGLVLKRTALRSMLIFASQSHLKSEQKRTIRTFYETQLKAKLFTFLHNSNLEFIKHQVHIEDYFLRRKKLRNVLKVLYKNSKM